MSYVDTLEKILDSKDVTSGGGTASAIAGAMACGLIGMAARLSLMKSYGLDDRKYLELAEELDEMNFLLLRGAQEDLNAYGIICTAMKLPRDNEEEITLRQKTIQEAGINAATILRDNGDLCMKVLKIGLMLKGNSDVNAAADLQVGISLAEAGILGCAEGIRVTLPLIKDSDIVKAFKEDIDKLKEKDNYYERIYSGRQH